MGSEMCIRDSLNVTNIAVCFDQRSDGSLPVTCDEGMALLAAVAKLLINQKEAESITLNLPLDQHAIEQRIQRRQLRAQFLRGADIADNISAPRPVKRLNHHRISQLICRRKSLCLVEDPTVLNGRQAVQAQEPRRGNFVCLQRGQQNTATAGNTPPDESSRLTPTDLKDVASNFRHLLPTLVEQKQDLPLIEATEAVPKKLGSPRTQLASKFKSVAMVNLGIKHAFSQKSE